MKMKMPYTDTSYAVEKIVNDHEKIGSNNDKIVNEHLNDQQKLIKAKLVDRKNRSFRKSLSSITLPDMFYSAGGPPQRGRGGVLGARSERGQSFQ